MTIAMALPRFETFLQSARQKAVVHSPTSPMQLQAWSPLAPASPPQPMTPALPPLHELTSWSRRHSYEYSPESPQASPCGDSYCYYNQDSSSSSSSSYYTHLSPVSSYQAQAQPSRSFPVQSAQRTAVKVQATAMPTTRRARRVKKKYLKEKQRCEIVRRVRAGEKQAHLAKEFGVSRAAVCYLLKHESEILERFAMHTAERQL